MEENSFILSATSLRNYNDLPCEYQFLEVLGAGTYGKVIKCYKKDTKETVAVKMPKFLRKESMEVFMMERLMCLKMDQRNIIKFFGWFETSCGKAMVFESLDISLDEYIDNTSCRPMLLSDICTIIQQLATAFDALKGIGMIHTDLKPDNIMMADHNRRPFVVKLIDFGMAMHRSKAKQGAILQVIHYRAPEIILGLPFSEAIDVWSLGCVMSTMLNGSEVFRGHIEYEALQDIIALLGVPADHLLSKGQFTKQYFTKTERNSWRLKTDEEFWREFPHKKYQKAVCYTLDDLRKRRLEKENIFEAVERSQCIDLLEAMLDLDKDERITPIEILTHPFITNGQKRANIDKNSFSLPCKKKNTHCGPDPVSQEIPPSVIMVRPATTTSRMRLDHDEMRLESLTSAVSEGDNNHPDHCSSPTPSVGILAPPASVERTSLSEGILAPPASVERTTLSEGILAPPASVESTLQIVDKECPDCVQDELMDKSVTVMDGDMTTAAHGQSGTKKDKKKKNLVRRVSSWMRKTFSCCCTTSD